jgi:metal-dependent amidase/aminoacylase/carboxypeptidase family protein
VGDHEFAEYHLLTSYLENEGFTITREAVGLKTAFIAEFSNGKPGRCIGFCSEFDGLPG